MFGMYTVLLGVSWPKAEEWPSFALCFGMNRLLSVLFRGK